MALKSPVTKLANGSLVLHINRARSLEKSIRG